MRNKPLPILLALALVGASAAAFAQYEPPADNDTKMPEWSMDDTDRDGYLSKEELIPFPGVLEKFEMIDTNGDNKLSEAEYADYRAGRTSPPHSH